MDGEQSHEVDYLWLQSLVTRVSEYAIFRLTEHGEVASWNPGARHIQGYEADEILGRHFSTFYLVEDRCDGVPEAGLKAAREHGQYETEGWRVRKDGTRFWASVLTTALVTADGKFLGYGKIVRDTTDKRLAYEAVKESERRFRLLVQGVTDYSIFMLSPEGYVTNWNLGAARIKGYEASEIVGAHFRKFYTPQDAAEGLPERGLNIATTEGRFETERWRVRKDGSRFWANVVIDAIRDEEGELTQNAIVHGGRLDPGVHLLSKPYSREQLALKIRRLLGPTRKQDMSNARAPQSGAETIPGPIRAPTELSVLVVDDDGASREAVSELLTSMGYNAQQAADAEKAMQMLVTAKPDVLLTDIVLPGKSGRTRPSRI